MQAFQPGLGPALALWTCLVIAGCWAVPYPEWPNQTCLALLARAVLSCMLASEALPSAGLVTMLSFWLTFLVEPLALSALGHFC